MSEPINDGGPAFPLFLPPSETGEHILPIQYGMSLRDWLAGQALVGFMAIERDAKASGWDSSYWAHWAYKTADAMLKAREAKP